MPDNGLKDALDSIKKVAHDFLTIDVTTFSAPNVKFDFKEGKAFELNNLFTELKAQVKNGSELILVAHTHVDFDLDAVMVVNDGAASGLLEAHNKAVLTAIEGRQAVVKALKDMF